jgi:hypothetical protein
MMGFTHLQNEQGSTVDSFQPKLCCAMLGEHLSDQVLSVHLF